MTVTTLSSSAISSRAIFGLNQATREITDSTERLSSGSRFVNAGDDIGALASSNRLNAQLIGMRQGQTNNLQANSLLQTAFSAASEINDVLSAMKALSVQANSGTLTTVERATLDLEFQELRAEIDSLADGTNFNDIKLLDGSASGQGDLQQKTNDASRGSATLSFTGTFGSGFSIGINGVRFAGSAFGTGASASDSATNLFNYLNTSSNAALRELEYEIDGTTITATARAGGSKNQSVTINNVSGHANLTVTGGATLNANEYALSGGADDGLHVGSTSVSGAVGDSLVDSLGQTQSEYTLTIVDNASIDTSRSLFQLEDGQASNALTFSAVAAPATANEFLLGATAEETLKNLVGAMGAYSGTDDFILKQLEFEVNDNVLSIRSVLPGLPNELELGGNGVIGMQSGQISSIAVGLGASSTQMTTGADTGVNVDNVMNANFIGSGISGFSATYNSADNIDASITVGDDTYTATIADTTPAASTQVTFVSSTGGAFRVDLAAGGMSVADQSDADTYAARLDAAFSSLTFTQSRLVDNFVASGQLAEGRALFTSDDFAETPIIDSVSVRDSTLGGGKASIEFVIDGESFTNTNLGTYLGAYEMFDLQSTSSGKSLRIFNGNAQADLSDTTAAATYEATLRNAFGTDTEGSASLEFQIGSESSDKLAVTIGKATSDSLFDGETPDLLSQANAVLAQTSVDNALDEIGTIIADIGASQARLDYSYNATASSIIEIDFARGQLADTDVASESSAYAEAVVQQQAAISVLAQTQLLSANLLDLLKSN